MISKKSHNVINIISAISVVGVMVGTMGLIIVLSVFNGFGGLVLSLYDSFDADLKITPVKGKFFDPNATNMQRIQSLESIQNFSLILEENALLKYRDRQCVAKIKGVGEHYTEMINLKKNIIDGEFVLNEEEQNFAVIGSGIAWKLSVILSSPFNILNVYVPNADYKGGINVMDAFRAESVTPAGIFALQQDFDSKYVLVPISFARKVIGQKNNVSSIEINFKEGVNQLAEQNKINELLGSDYKSSNRLEQHDFLYKILKSEKWAVYMILGFILFISSFNILGSMTMLTIDKKEDAITLVSLGADKKLIQNIFFLEGLLIALSGAVIGLFLGGLICFLQQTFGIIPIENAESFVVDSYPVQMMFTDFLSVFALVGIIGSLGAWFTSRQLVTRYLSAHLSL
ncbi:MAG: ABC transporter permease [Bacteroidia bacterium]|nr:ABC transporter permease [Bacteroidia bacterium]NNC86205.1 ABC transporter permease [Bacteroidia bacterium]NNM15126.1 ABC transporter permease [Bacteroidia bacterium]